ncbi:MAG: type II toxin-antitoxin system RelE/ParE family toxin [Mailhella sp.]|nr:type II toxin-antitoxin system RelE/ParE family toxin [Mailhella sp.]
MSWSVTFLNELVYEEFLALPKSLIAVTLRIVDLIEKNGLEKTGMPYVRHLQDKLWEIRAKGKDGIARSLYVTASGRRVVIVRCFVKKTQRTPDKELKLALQRAKEVE